MSLYLRVSVPAFSIETLILFRGVQAKLLQTVVLAALKVEHFLDTKFVKFKNLRNEIEFWANLRNILILGFFNKNNFAEIAV